MNSRRREMKVYVCRGYHTENWHEPCDDFEADEVVVANTPYEALGFCLQWHTKSKESWWDISEVNTARAGVHTDLRG